MTPIHADVALLTERRYEAAVAAEGDWYLGNILEDDRLLQEALGGLGLTSVRLDWARPGIDWSRFRTTVFRTTWDYFERFAEFSAWLDRAAGQTRLLNSRATVEWNWDKHYLADLEKAGIPVVPCRFVERGSAETLAGLLAETGWEEAVIKPCVSGSARHTYRIAAANLAQIEPVVQSLLGHESLILQPFQHDIVRGGEDTLVMIDGHYSHAVRKVAKPGDFRVQDDHGGTAYDHTPTADQIDLAERAMAACPTPPAYGRVDMVRSNDGHLAVMELELIEPELWLRRHPPAAKALAGAIAARL